MGALALAAVTGACGSGLTGSQWLWCKVHASEVDAAAESLALAKAQRSFDEPSWWSDFVSSTLNSNNAVLTANGSFTEACDAAAQARDVVGDARVSWCMTDGLGEVWAASIQLGHMVNMESETFAYKAIPLQERLTDPDFVSACRAALG